MKQELTQELIKNYIEYNEETGIFKWKIRTNDMGKTKRGVAAFNSNYAMNSAGTITKNGYLSIKITDFFILAHRLAWIYVYGVFPKSVDHINGNKLDNRVCNLREATKSENAQNIRKALSNNKSTGLLGASFMKKENKYRAYITINRATRHLGCFKTAEEAHQAYVIAKREIHPFGML